MAMAQRVGADDRRIFADGLYSPPEGPCMVALAPGLTGPGLTNNGPLCGLPCAATRKSSHCPLRPDATQFIMLTGPLPARPLTARRLSNGAVKLDYSARNVLTYC